MKETKRLALTSIFAAFAVIFATAGSIVPVGSGILFLIASAMTACMLCECGARYALAGFAASSLLMLILSADKTLPAMYIMYTGWYPVAKVNIEQLPKKYVRFILKAATGIIPSALGYFAANALGFALEWYWLLLLILSALLYDRALDSIMMFYQRKLRKYIKFIK